MKKNRVQIIREVSHETGYANADVTVVVDTLMSILKQNALDGNECKIDYLTIGSKVKEAHTSRNPKTGESIDVPERLMPYAKLGSGIKKEFKGV